MVRRIFEGDSYLGIRALTGMLQLHHHGDRDRDCRPSKVTIAGPVRARVGRIPSEVRLFGELQPRPCQEVEESDDIKIVFTKFHSDVLTSFAQIFTRACAYR